MFSERRVNHTLMMLGEYAKEEYRRRNGLNNSHDPDSSHGGGLHTTDERRSVALYLIWFTWSAAVIVKPALDRKLCMLSR